MNSKEFSADFGCALDTPMNPSNKCSVWSSLKLSPPPPVRKYDSSYNMLSSFYKDDIHGEMAKKDEDKFPRHKEQLEPRSSKRKYSSSEYQKDLQKSEQLQSLWSLLSGPLG